MGHITEIVAMEKRPVEFPCKKIDRDHYVDLRTGEVKKYQVAENRSQSTDSIRHTIAHIRALINANILEADNCRWVTLTYGENMTDTECLRADFSAFWKRFKRHCVKMGYGQPEYITVQEPQGRGAWHIHAFFIWDSKAPYIPSSIEARDKMKNPPEGVKSMQELWGRGFTSVKALNDVDNIGAYFSAYLADMPLDEILNLPDAEKVKIISGGTVLEKSFENSQETVKNKRFVKGGRLILYPAGMNIVRRSKGIKDPIVEHMSLEKAREKVSSAKLTFSRNLEIFNDSGESVNIISKSYYNSKRKANQEGK